MIYLLAFLISLVLSFLVNTVWFLIFYSTELNLWDRFIKTLGYTEYLSGLLIFTIMFFTLFALPIALLSRTGGEDGKDINSNTA